MHRASRLTALAIFAAAGIMGACKKKPDVAPAPAPATPPAETCNQACRDSIAKREADSLAALERDRVAREAATREAAVARVKATMAEKILFNYDQSDLSDQARAVLDAKVAIMRANPQLRIRVGGHADSRGSDEYNFALGQRRAVQAKRYMTDQGIDGLRIDVASFGEEQPAVQGETEEAWSQNRRGEFEIVAGAETITVPQ